MVVRVKCEGEWNSIIILLSETFVVLTADQFVGRDDGLLEQQRQDIHVCRRNRTFPLILRKNKSHHNKDDEVQETENKE